MATVLFILGDKASPTAGDAALIARVEGLGHTVITRSDEDAEESSGFDTVIIAESVASTTMGVKYRDLAVPLMVMENALWDEYFLRTVPIVTGTATTIAVNTVTDLDAGLGGTTVSLYSSSGDIGRYDIASEVPLGGVVVAQAPSGDDVYFVAFENGSILATGTAPARRYAMGIFDASVAKLTTDGWALFDAAAQWLIPIPIEAELHEVLADENEATFIRSNTGAGSDVAEVSFGTVGRTAGDPPVVFTIRHRVTP